MFFAQRRLLVERSDLLPGSRKLVGWTKGGVGVFFTQGRLLVERSDLFPI